MRAQGLEFIGTQPLPYPAGLHVALYGSAGSPTDNATAVGHQVGVRLNCRQGVSSRKTPSRLLRCSIEYQMVRKICPTE